MVQGDELLRRLASRNLSENGEIQMMEVLLTDVNRCRLRQERTDNSANRRDLVRAAFAAIEGFQWIARLDVIYCGGEALSPSEVQALREEGYSVTHDGEVRERTNSLTLLAGLRLLVNLASRFVPELKLMLSSQGWADLQDAIRVRNRIVHPKRIVDLAVSDKELEASFAGLAWVFEVCARIQVAQVEMFSDAAEQLLSNSKDIPLPDSAQRKRANLKKAVRRVKRQMHKLAVVAHLKNF